MIGDESAFDGLRGAAARSYRLSFDVGPLSALTFNRGLTAGARPLFQASPPTFAAKAVHGARCGARA